MAEDEGVQTTETFVVDFGSEAVAEPLFHYGASRLSWDDLMNASLVSYGWNQGVINAIQTSGATTAAYKVKYPKEEVQLPLSLLPLLPYPSFPFRCHLS